MTRIFKQRKIVAKSGILTIYFVGYDPENDDFNDYHDVTSLISAAEGIHFRSLNERKRRVHEFWNFDLVHSCCSCQA